MYQLCLILALVVFSIEALEFQTKNGVLPLKEECGVASANKSPWVVFIPAQSRVFNPDANIRCSGALISKRYVILNKSCLQFALTKIHLGQIDTTKEDGVLKLDIEKRIIDDNRDVILLRLSEDVKFTDNIQPICLPFDNFKRAAPGDAVYSSGWGLTSVDGPNTKLKKSVKGTVVKTCTPTSHQIIKNGMCVKVQEGSIDKACSGDEGSPVMYYVEDRWVLQGVMIGLFHSTSKPCVLDEAAVASQITDEDLQWIIENVN